MKTVCYWWGGGSAFRLSDDFGADFDWVQQAISVLQGDGVEPAGEGECN